MTFEHAFADTIPDHKQFHLISARELQSKVFPPIIWMVEGMIPEGLTLFCGKPKLGKSWAALDLAFAVSDGSQFMGNVCDEGAVLYLALEDNERRLQDRLRKIRPSENWPLNLKLATSSPRLNEGGIEAKEAWIAGADNPRLIIVDTLATVKPIKGGKDSDYQADYLALRDLHRIASERRLAVVVVHHVRKADADDPFDTVSGSTGLTGAADATLILTRRNEGDGVILYGRGRDLPEFEHAVEFDLERCRWKMLGDPDTVFLSDTRRQILEALQAGKKTLGGIAIHTGLTDVNVRQTLSRMVKKGQVNRGERGCYTLPDNTPSTPVTTVTLSQTQLEGENVTLVTNVTGVEPPEYSEQDFA
jgi:hypothetical protein